MSSIKLFDLTGKTAIVTGGGRGLGHQMSIALAEMGASVVACSRRVENCEALVKEIEALGGEALALPCDITKPEAVENVVNRTLEKFGTIDILVNNSGASWGAPALEMPLEAWHKVMEVNVTGTFLMTQAVARHMVERGEGSIINLASVAALKGSEPEIMDAIGYQASKGAIVSFTRDMAAKLGPKGVRVNAIAPGFFPTKMSKGVLEVSGERVLEHTPLRRFGGNEDLKGAVIYLASKASDFVTGHVLVVDGGSTAV
ncbi:SDR family oxidoreductase [Pullulanibacillus sp. KACC 23026]|uniref:SDR family oxidoreductase n=1 Tax=Pullulanibacillus sp. KACC 23026 TaxID=3028315 RepID=UPI0023B14B2C|nr:SDR family oxidoreductase [Pullulanibacillus sp. KACC 23026]WEG12044.1 SDR family oxidoreductase [Pullulanibacillus sp. KACC 23026]